MKSSVTWTVVALFAAAGLLAPAAVLGQSREGARHFGGSGRHGGGFGRGHFGGDHDRRHVGTSFSFWVGPGWDPWWWGPFGYPYYYPYSYRYSYPYYYPYYAEPPVVVEPPAQEEEAPAPQQETYSWYYCQDPAGYYPYVRECPSGWTKVAPSPQTESAPAEGSQTPPASSPGNPPPEYFWYYCEDPPGYYPYVRDCPRGWREVAPQPAPAR
ncbi:MAG TPA: hypothetical protein VI078_03740 [bacterium]